MIRAMVIASLAMIGTAHADQLTRAQANLACAGLARWESGYDQKDPPKDRAVARQDQRIVVDKICPLLFPVLAK